LNVIIFLLTKGAENTPMVLVGNKSDLAYNRAVINKRANELASDLFKCGYIEASAKENLNVTKIFNSIVDIVYKDMEEMKEALNIQNNVNRRNSSISFVRRISVSTVNRVNLERRFSEPAAQAACSSAKTSGGKKSQKASASGKDSGKESSTPTSTHKRKQKNCTIS
jgi:50S ribosomal subunit-associated GTPase HflX